MLNEVVGNVAFREIPAEGRFGPRVGLKIGGVGLTLQSSTWDDLVRLVRKIGEIPKVENAVDGDDKNIVESEQSANQQV